MDSFGDTNPKKMPPHFFFKALNLDFSTATRANTASQNYTVAPRHWYLDARFRCAACPKDFVWSAQEQKAWFEEFGFYVDSQPTLCPRCRADRRNATRLRKEYDALVTQARSGGTTEQRVRIVQIVDELESCLGFMPEKLLTTRDAFRKSLGGESKPAANKPPLRS